LDPGEGGQALAIAVREADAVGVGRPQVGLDQPEHVEVTLEPRAAVEEAEGAGEPRGHARLPEVGRRERASLGELDDEDTQVGEVSQDTRSHPEPRRHLGVVTLALPVEAEECRVVHGETDDVATAVHGDEVTRVRHPARERRDGELPAPPRGDAAHDRVEVGHHSGAEMARGGRSRYGRACWSRMNRAMLWREGPVGRRSTGNQRASSSSSRSTVSSPPAYRATKPTMSWLG